MWESRDKQWSQNSWLAVHIKYRLKMVTSIDAISNPCTKPPAPSTCFQKNNSQYQQLFWKTTDDVENLLPSTETNWKVKQQYEKTYQWPTDQYKHAQDELAIYKPSIGMNEQQQIQVATTYPQTFSSLTNLHLIQPHNSFYSLHVCTYSTHRQK